MTYIKICGIRFFDDAVAAIEAGADYLGFNFYSRSSRFIEPACCKKIAELLKNRYPQVRLVGVFVNTPLPEIRNVQKACLLDKVQLHGDESPLMVQEMEGAAYKAFRGTPKIISDYLVGNEAPAFLMDADASQAYGGTGQLTNWDQAARLAEQYRFFLAGGLKPENVAAAVQQVKPWGVDVASGVESAPGHKDRDKMKAFVRAVRQADKQEQVLQNYRIMLERI